MVPELNCVALVACPAGFTLERVETVGLGGPAEVTERDPVNLPLHASARESKEVVQPDGFVERMVDIAVREGGVGGGCGSVTVTGGGFLVAGLTAAAGAAFLTLFKRKRAAEVRA